MGKILACALLCFFFQGEWSNAQASNTSALARVGELMGMRTGRYLMTETEEGARIARMLLGRELRSAGEVPLLTASAVRNRAFGPQLEERLGGLIDEFERLRGEPPPRSLRSRFGLAATEESLLRRLSRERLRLGSLTESGGRRFFKPMATPSSVASAHEELFEAGAQAGRTHTPLLDGFLKFPGGSTADELADLTRLEDLIPNPSALGPIPWQASRDARLAAIAEYPLDRAVVAPGHRYLGKGDKLRTLREHIRNTRGGEFAQQPIVLNLIVDDTGRILSADIWDAHHRLVAYLEEGYRHIGDIPQRNLRVLVNGTTEWGEAWAHHLPVAGLDVDALRAIHTVDRAPRGTLSLSGRVSNYALGSRTTLGRLRQVMTTRRPPKIGVYFDAFDPVTESHLAFARRMKSEMELDEVLLIPHAPTGTSASAHDRIAMLSARLRNERGLNVFTGDAEGLLARFEETPLIQRVGQAYGTHDIARISSGSFTGPQQLHPDVADYISARGLYR